MLAAQKLTFHYVYHMSWSVKTHQLTNNNIILNAYVRGVNNLVFC